MARAMHREGLVPSTSVDHLGSSGLAGLMARGSKCRLSASANVAGQSDEWVTATLTGITCHAPGRSGVGESGVIPATAEQSGQRPVVLVTTRAK